MSENAISIYQLLNAYCNEIGDILGRKFKPTYRLSSVNGRIATIIIQLNEENRAIAQIDIDYDYDNDGVDFSVNQYALNIYPNERNQHDKYIRRTLSKAEISLRHKDFPLYKGQCVQSKDAYAVTISNALFLKIYKKCTQKLHSLENDLRLEMSLPYIDAVTICELATTIHDTATTLLYLQQEKQRRNL